jgi:hypothetical protein
VKTNPKALAVLIGVLVVLVLAGGGSAYLLRDRPPEPEAIPIAQPTGPVIATVDGRPIYLNEAASRVEGLTGLHEGFELDEEWQERILMSLVDDLIVRVTAGELGLEMSQEELRVHVDNLRSNFGTQDAFDAWLDGQGMDLAELARRVELQTLAARVYEEVTSGAQVSLSEAKAYYKEHRDEYDTPDGAVPDFLFVRDQIEQDLLKSARDEVFAEWLKEQEAQVDLVVVDDEWWKEIA